MKQRPKQASLKRYVWATHDAESNWVVTLVHEMTMKTKLLVIVAALLVGCSKPAAGPAGPAIPPLDQLMPQFEIRSNAVNSFQIAFQPHGDTNWIVVTNIIPSLKEAQIVVAKSKERLREKYEAYVALSAVFTNKAK